MSSEVMLYFVVTLQLFQD